MEGSPTKFQQSEAKIGISTNICNSPLFSLIFSKNLVKWQVSVQINKVATPQILADPRGVDNNHCCIL